MKTLVTGASGHVGANLVRALLEEGREVRTLVHYDDEALENLEVEQVKGDVTDYDSIEKAFAGVDHVFHLAAKIAISNKNSELVHKVNVQGPRNVVKACLEHGVKRLVHFSSIHVRNPNPKNEVIDEDRPGSFDKGLPTYDRTKALGELEIMKGVEAGLDAVIVCPTAILGPYDYKPSYMGRTLLELFQHKLPGLVKGGFDWVDVRDIVHGALQAEKLGRTGEKYLLSGEWRPFIDLAKCAQEVSGVQAPSFVSPMWLARIGAPFVENYARLLRKDPRYTSVSLRAIRNHRYISHEKATQELGYNPRPLIDTVRDTYEWFKTAGMLKA